MLFKVAFLMFFINCACSRHAPPYNELDEDEQALFRAAYDSPSYDHVEAADQDLAGSKLDLLKDVMWALKAKLQEIKAFNKAMAANMLSSKFQLKELKSMIQPLAHHHHKALTEKPSYSYQTPTHAYGPAAPVAPAPSYEPAYAAPPQTYSAPSAVYAPPKPYSQQNSGAQELQYDQQYAAPQHAHDPYYGV